MNHERGNLPRTRGRWRAQRARGDSPAWRGRWRSQRGAASGEEGAAPARGAVLAMMIMMALVAAISIYAILFMASSQARQAAFSLSSIRARYAAEVGLVWAQQRLQENPGYCPGLGALGDPDPPAVGGIAIDVVRADCVSPTPKITAKVVY